MKLFLEDGSVYEGESFGANAQAKGEVVFSTGMTGYVETLTDPSYAGQILVCTYPLIGNYGVPSAKSFESSKIHVSGLVVATYSHEYSHYSARESLAHWLRRSGIPAIEGVDTRAITKKMRELGVMLGALGQTRIPAFSDPNQENLVAKVSPKRVRVYGRGAIRIVAVDCGMKENILRSLVRPETTVVRVPWDYDFTTQHYDALVLSNGPGDPSRCQKTISHIRLAMKAGKPILGVCLGNQLLAHAAGATTYKLKYGHRGQNQPCIDTIGRAAARSSSSRCYITSQNHGFAVDEKKLPSEWNVWFTNANDGTNEGIRHKSKPWRSVQFHPEAAPGPTDTAWIFDDFLRDVASLCKLTRHSHGTYA